MCATLLLRDRATPFVKSLAPEWSIGNLAQRTPNDASRAKPIRMRILARLRDLSGTRPIRCLVVLAEIWRSGLSAVIESAPLALSV